LQLKPLTNLHASKFTNPKNIPILLNTPFSILTTLSKKGLEKKKYFPLEEAIQIFPIQHQYNFPDSSFRNMNVVIILLESFSREYSGYLNNYSGYTPFLDSLMKKSSLMTQAFSNGRRSIDAVPSINISIPSLMNNPFITSPYSSNKIHSLAHILKTEGYTTSFFHGASNGSMNFDAFASLSGFDNYYGRTEYNNEKDFDGKWGIFDEPFLQFFANKLSSFQQPFFAMEFTISSHHPYTIPEHYKGKFKEGPLKIQKVVNYTDYALQKFFATVSKTNWYKNTIFVILADHPAQSVDATDNLDLNKNDKIDKQLVKYYKSTVGRFAIPILYFVPSDTTIIGQKNLTTQQIDLLPSILNYLKYNKKFVSFGSSIFDSTAKHVSVEYFNNLFQITEDNYSLVFDGEKSLSLFDNLLDPENKTNLLTSKPKISQQLERTLKSIIQQYNYRLMNNKLIPQ
jgi:phosphoglycerol transferase MdoB-like AlkP superfamily enzyme